MKKKIFFIFTLLLMVLMILYEENREKECKYLINNKKKEYIDISNYQNYYNLDISGIILDKYISKKLYDKGTTYLTLNNKSKLILYEIYNNYSYKPSDLIDFLRVNDSIRKPPNSRDFFIYRNNEKYYFRLGEDIKTK